MDDPTLDEAHALFFTVVQEFEEACDLAEEELSEPSTPIGLHGMVNQLTGIEWVIHEM